ASWSRWVRRCGMDREAAVERWPRGDVWRVICRDDAVANGGTKSASPGGDCSVCPDLSGVGHSEHQRNSASVDERDPGICVGAFAEYRVHPEPGLLVRQNAGALCEVWFLPRPGGGGWDRSDGLVDARLGGQEGVDDQRLAGACWGREIQPGSRAEAGRFRGDEVSDPDGDGVL